MKKSPMWIRLLRVGVLALILNFWVVGGHHVQAAPQEARYRYVSLDQIALPPGFTSFTPSAIQDSGRVYGTLCDATCGFTQLAYFKDGQLTVLPPVPPGSFSLPVNASGTIGGYTNFDPVNFTFRAALFKDDKVTLIPQQPGEQFSWVLALNDNDTALVESDDPSGRQTFVLYRAGTATPINFGPSITHPFFSFEGNCRCINNNGIIEGIELVYKASRGFRFDTRNGTATILDPFPGDPTETLAWGQAINQSGDVLGYSFTFFLSQPYHERIGVWGRDGVFETYLVESDNSNRLLFNDNKLIVITDLSPPNSYIVPRPGVRLNLADLVVNMPAGQDLQFIRDLNNHGDIIGISTTGANFLLHRLDQGEPQEFETPVVISQRHAVHPGMAIIRNRLQPKFGPFR
jgi:hypothetical protein